MLELLGVRHAGALLVGWLLLVTHLAQPIRHNLANLEELSTIDPLILILLHLHIMQLYNLHKLLHYHALVVGSENVLGKFRPFLYFY